MHASLPLLLMALGCGTDEPDPKPDTGTPADTEIDCPEGEIADGDGCVPEACGTGPWGELELDDATVYVDASADESGDGSGEAPYPTLQAALDAVAGGAGPMVAIAAGAYQENLDLDHEHADIHLAGRCRELVALDASGGDSGTPGINLSMSASTATLSGLTVRDAGYAGLMIWSGDVLLHDVAVHGNGYSGVGVYPGNFIHDITLLVEDSEIHENVGVNIGIHEPDSQVIIRDSVVRDGVRGSSGETGIGILVKDGASLELESSTVSGNRNQGLNIQEGDNTVVVRDSLISGQLPEPSGRYGSAVQITSGSLTIESSTLEGNTHQGIMAQGDEVEISLYDTVIRNTVAPETGDYGVGVQMSSGSVATIEGCELSDNQGVSVLASGEGTTLTLTDTVVRDGQTLADGSYGDGVWIQDGARAEIQNVTVENSATTGIYALEEGTVVTVSNSLIQGVRPDDQALYGNAISVGLGASLTVTDTDVTDNTGIGLLASDAGTQVTLNEVLIQGTARGEYYTAALGLSVQTGASVVATGLSVQETEGPALFSGWESTSLDCADCTLTSNEFAGVVAVGGATTSLEGLTIQDTTTSSNLGGGVGVYAEPWGLGPPTLSVRDSTILDNPIAGVWLAGEGAYQLSGNDIQGGDGETRGTLQRCGDAVFATDGVSQWDGSSGLELVDNTLSHGRGAGLFLDDATATVLQTSWEDNDVDLVVQGGSCDTAPEGLSDGELGSVELCPIYDYSTCGDLFTILLQLSDPEDSFLLAPPPLTP